MIPLLIDKSHFIRELVNAKYIVPVFDNTSEYFEKNIASDNNSGYFYSNFSLKTIVDTRLNHVSEMVWKSSCNLCFYGELDKIITELSLLDTTP